MRSALVVIALALGACATKPPPLPTCEGDLTPINAVAKS
jgi:hypothetical protein